MSIKNECKDRIFFFLHEKFFLCIAKRFSFLYNIQMGKKRPTYKTGKKRKVKPTKSAKARQVKQAESPEPGQAKTVEPGQRQPVSAGQVKASAAAPGFFRKHRYLLIILLAAFIFRLGYFIEMKEDPEFLHANVDALYHDYWAWGIVTGEWQPPHDLQNPHIESRPYFRPPFYPYYLSAVYRVFGHSKLAPRLLQMLIGILSCAILFLVARKIFGDQIAFISGLIMAFYWAFVFYEKELREVSLLVLFLPLLILWLMKLYEKPAIRRFVLCGFLLGIIIITRPNFLLFIPFAVGWLFVYSKLKDKKKKYLHIGIFLLCTILPISAVTLRNVIKGKDFVLISSNGGINLYVGNNPTATGNTIALPPEIPLFRNAFMYSKIVKHVEGEVGKELKHSQVSSYFTRRALAYMKENPSRTIAMAFRKALMFIGGVEIPSERDLVAGRNKSRVLKIIPLNFALVFALCLMGMIVYFTTIVKLKKKKQAGQERALPVPEKSSFHFVVLVLFLAGIYYLSYLPFFITSRFRMCIIPFLILFAGYMVYQIYRKITLKQLAAAGMLLAGVVFIYLIGNVNYFGFQRDMAKAEYDRGLAFARAKNYEAAIQSYRRAIRHRPKYADAYNNLGNMLRETGRDKQAVVNYEKALEYEPRHYFANLNLAQINYTMNRLGKASDYYAKALEIKPTEYIYNILSNTHFKNGKVDKAITVLNDAMKTYGRKANFLNNLGILYVFKKDFEKAGQTFSEVLKQNADDVQALANMGRLYSNLERPEEAKKYFERVLKLDPRNKAAQEFLKKKQSP